MKLFHVLMGGAEHRALRLFDDNSLNLPHSSFFGSFWRPRLGMEKVLPTRFSMRSVMNAGHTCPKCGSHEVVVCIVGKWM